MFNSDLRASFEVKKYGVVEFSIDREFIAQK